MKIAVVGSRTFTDYDLLRRTLDRVRLMFHDRDITIVSGGAPGADSLAERYSQAVLNKHPIVYKAEWSTYGKVAGFRRNREIVDESDFVVAFWDGVSRGTNHTMNLTTKVGKPILVVPFDSKPPENQEQMAASLLCI